MHRIKLQLSKSDLFDKRMTKYAAETIGLIIKNIDYVCYICWTNDRELGSLQLIMGQKMNYWTHKCELL